jgi:hypothetical protein
MAQHATKDVMVGALGDPGAGPGSWIARVDLGEALFKLGAYEESMRELQRAVDQRGVGASAFYGSPTLRYVPPVRYWLARAKDALHRKDAKSDYEAFLALERKAQGDPLVADAQKRLGVH